MHKQSRYARIVNPKTPCRKTEVRMVIGGGSTGPQGRPGLQGKQGIPGKDGATEAAMETPAPSTRSA